MTAPHQPASRDEAAGLGNLALDAPSDDAAGPAGAPARSPTRRYWLQLASISLLGVVLVVGVAIGLLAASGLLVARLPAPQAVAPGAFAPGFAYADADGVWGLADDGRQRARLLAAPRGAVLKAPAWRPGSREIVYAATRPYQRGGNNGTDLRAIGWDGADDRVLVDHGEADHHLEWPAFAGDGSLYFSHSHPVIEGGAFKGETSVIERLDPATGERRTIAEGASQPSVSADGRRLSFLRVYRSGAAQLWLAAGDGGDAHPAIAGDQEFAYYYSPRLSPDGRTIALSATGGLGSRRTALPRPPLARLADWFAPVAEAHGGGPWEIWLVDAASGATRRLVSASSQGDEMSLAWSPDSRRLAYLTRGAVGIVDVAADQQTLIADDTGLGDIAWPMAP